MTEQDTPESDVSDEPVEETVEEPEPSRPPPKNGRSGNGFIAWVALFLAAIAFASAGYNYLQHRSEGDSAAQAAAEQEAALRNLTASVSATQQAMQALENRLGDIGAGDAELNAAIERLDRQLNNRLRNVESLPGRVSTIEASMATLQGISTGARDAWLLAEAEYYMQIANAQLQLASNPELAMLALNHADERIAQLGDPRLTPVRQALSDELRSLEVMEKPDTAGITLTLSSLAMVVDSLPLQQEVVADADAAGDGIDPELTGMDRAWASVRNALDQVVSVRDADEVERPLNSPEAQYFLRANLSLQLQAARLALLRGEEEIFRQSLSDADQWLADYYAPDSSGVQSARQTIAEVRDSVLSVAIPDISQSLRLLRQYNRLSDAATDDVEPAPEPEAEPEPEDAEPGTEPR
jgi:uroporphyrin-3 C-methyltransferase